MDSRIRDLLFEIEEFAKNNFMFNIPREGGELLNLIVNIRKPKKILEIGTSNGYSTIWLGMEGYEVYTIEIDKEKIKLARENFKKAGLKKIKILEDNALETLPKLKEKFDFVFLDAIKKDYLNYFKLINFDENAVVIADNIITHEKQVKEYVEYVRKNHKSYFLDIGNGMEVTIVNNTNNKHRFIN